MLTMRSLGLLHSTLLIAASVAACGGDDVAASGDGTGASSSSGGSDGTSSGSGDTGTTAVADTTATTEPDTSGTTGTPVDSSGTAVVDESSSSSGTPNEDPIAIDDLYAMVMNDAPLQLTADVGVLVNDSDPDGDPLTVADFDAVSEAGGAVVVDDDGALTYTPPADFWGPDGFTYTIDDGNGGSATAHVRVTVTPTTISLGEVTGGVGGFTIDGAGAGLQTGWSVAGGGDVDGDGHADVLVGAPSSDIDGNGEGRAFVVFGKSTGETVALGDVLLGEGGFAIDGDADTDQAGFSVAHAGDVNGDGLADVIVGAPQADPIADDEGRAYVVFGKADGDTVALETLAADGHGFVIEGSGANDLAGTAVAGGVDLNGDGLDDVIVGAPFANVGGIANAGRTWVVFGKTDTDAVLLADVDGGAGGFAINGISTEDRAGESVAGAGDIDGDGLDDLVVGAPFANPSGNNSGRAFVVFGKTTTTTVNLSSVLAGNGGFAINGTAALDQAGDTVAGAGDVNGDGRVDVILGAPGVEVVADLAGRSYVVFGKADGTAVALADIVAGNGGFAMDGELGGDLSGWSVGGGGDLDGDGRGDVVVGAQSGDFVGTLAGRSYAVYAPADGATIPLATIATGQGGFAIDGELDHDVSGWSVANAADVSADGFADLVIGAYDAPQGDGIGRAYVVFGGDFDAGVGLFGTAGADELVGTDGDETIVGGDGDDTLRAQAGFDVVYGGGGDDVIVLGSPNLFRIDGGLGDDTLALDGDGITLDLPAYFETAIAGIEAVDLTGTGDNALFLETRDLRAMSRTSNTIVVLGDAGDQLVADLTGAGFVDLGAANGFASWGNGVLTLVVADAVEVFVSL